MPLELYVTPSSAKRNFGKKKVIGRYRGNKDTPNIFTGNYSDQIYCVRSLRESKIHSDICYDFTTGLMIDQCVQILGFILAMIGYTTLVYLFALT